MTTQQAAGKSSEETLTQAVARRLRGRLAEQMISRKKFSELTGWNRMNVYRRIRGEIALDTSELEHIEDVTGITAEFLLTGKDPVPTPSPPSDGPPSPLGTDPSNHRKGSALPRLDSNQQPFDCRHAA